MTIVTLSSLFDRNRTRTRATHLANATNVNTPGATRSTQRIVLNGASTNVEGNSTSIFTIARRQRRSPATLKNMTRNITRRVSSTLYSRIKVNFSSVIIALNLIDGTRTRVAISGRTLLNVSSKARREGRIRQLGIRQDHTIFRTQRIRRLLRRADRTAHLKDGDLRILVINEVCTVLRNLSHYRRNRGQDAGFIDRIQNRAFLIFRVLLRQDNRLVRNLARLVGLIVTTRTHADERVTVTGLLNHTNGAIGQLNRRTQRR